MELFSKIDGLNNEISSITSLKQGGTPSRWKIDVNDFDSFSELLEVVVDKCSSE